MRIVNFIYISLFIIIFFISSHILVYAAPGALQIASRSKFWANDFPDTLIILQHYYYYHASKSFDNDGKARDINDVVIHQTLTRLIRPWHFGNRDQYQYVIEGILPVVNFNIKNDNSGYKSGVANPMIYTSLGWNNSDKSTHLQLAAIWQIPLGDDDVVEALNGEDSGKNHALMPLVAIEQRFGNLWIDASGGYWHNFKDLDSDAKVSDYFELNGIVTYNFNNFKYPFWIYVQGDYTKYFSGDDKYGRDLDNEGHNYAVGPGAGIAIRPNITLDVKYHRDVEGKNTLRGDGINVRLFWAF